MINDAGAKNVTGDVHGRAEAIKQPVHSQDQRSVTGVDADSRQDNRHHYQPRFGNRRSTHGRECGRDEYNEHLSGCQLYAQRLRDENNRHRLIQCSAVHVDRGAKRKHKACRAI